MMIIATDAPMESRNLKRLAARAWVGMARTGSSASTGSGDYAIAFSTAPQVRIHSLDKALTQQAELLTNDATSPLFEAVIEATEEAIYNSMLARDYDDRQRPHHRGAADRQDSRDTAEVQRGSLRDGCFIEAVRALKVRSRAGMSRDQVS